MRLELGLDLKDSKHTVEAYLRTQSDVLRQLETAQAEVGNGFLKWVVAALDAVAISTYYAK